MGVCVCVCVCVCVWRGRGKSVGVRGEEGRELQILGAATMPGPVTNWTSLLKYPPIKFYLKYLKAQKFSLSSVII